MQNSAWIVLLRRIPPEQHDTLALVTTVGIEISMQNILRTEEDHLVIRGRLSGTTDTGRVFFVPYSQINYLGFQKEVKEGLIHALYGEPSAPIEAAEPKPDAAATPAAAGGPGTHPQAEVAPPPIPEANPPEEPPKPAGQFKIPRKSGLLERLRARAQAGPNAPPRSNP